LPYANIVHMYVYALYYKVYRVSLRSKLLSEIINMMILFNIIKTNRIFSECVTKIDLLEF